MYRKKKINIVRAACVMLCLTLVSVYMTSGMFAKFATGGKKDDKGRVAAFDVDVGDGGINEYAFVEEEMQPNGDYSVTVTNKSEVAVRYTIEIKFEENVPEYLKISRVDGANVTELPRPDGNDDYTEKIEGKKVILQGKDLIPKNGKETESIKFAIDYTKFDRGGGLSQPTETLNFTTTVKIVQVD